MEWNWVCWIDLLESQIMLDFFWTWSNPPSPFHPKNTNMWSVLACYESDPWYFLRPHCCLIVRGNNPLALVGGWFWEDNIFWGECARFTTWWCFEKWIWDSHIIYVSLLCSWPTSQHVINFPNEIAIYMEKCQLLILDNVYFQRRVVRNIFSIDITHK